jgi:3-(3-hydroxy-phenyl)propionate hydroxylase
MNETEWVVTDTEKVPVVIVGAGPVGLTAALLLARRGIDSLVLERHPAPYPLPRAVHIDGEVMRILQEAGVAEGFRGISRAMPGLRLLDSRLHTMAEFRRDNLVGAGGHPEASMFDQPDLEKVLAAAVAAEPRVRVVSAATVTGVANTATGASVRYDLDGAEKRVDARFVLGCDGAGSTVRAALDIQFRDLGFAEPWLVVDIRARKPLVMWEGVHQVCASGRAATYMHLVGDRYRWEFRILESDDLNELTSDEGVARLLAPWSESVDPADLEVIRVASYTFRARVAEHWRVGSVFLLGDAAHLTPPFIGQGLGAGLRDAHNLVWKMAGVFAGNSPADFLDSYEAERSPHAVSQIRSAVAIGWALTGGSGPTAALRRTLVRALSRIPAVSTAALSASSPRLKLLQLARAHATVGTLLPQPRDGEEWFDDRLGNGYALITLDAIADSSSGVTIIAVPPSSELGRWLSKSKVRAVIVRPDRVVAAVARTSAEIGSVLDAVAQPVAEGARSA